MKMMCWNVKLENGVLFCLTNSNSLRKLQEELIDITTIHVKFKLVFIQEISPEALLIIEI